MIWTLVQTFDDLPRHFGWLSGEEMARCSTLKNAKRRGDWLLGRWTAKRLVADVIGTHSLSDIVVLSARRRRAGSLSLRRAAVQPVDQPLGRARLLRAGGRRTAWRGRGADRPAP
ncbi:MAG: hypothetical protein U0703_17060 [Anaerolineae bacterium]